MNKLSAVVLACGIILSGFGVWSLTAAPKQKLHHPIHHALKRLHEAKGTLEKAPHKYGGHRAKAVHEINDAIRQLHAAIKYVEKKL